MIALVFDKSVEAIVMFAEPSKLWPAIVLAVASVVAVSALPVTSPVTSPTKPEAVTVELNVAAPAAAISINNASTFEPPSVPLILNDLSALICKSKSPAPLRLANLANWVPPSLK